MKKALILIPAVALAAWLAIAQDKPAKPDVFDAVAAKPARLTCSDVGRFQVIVTGQPHPMVMKLDTATGETWEYQSVSVDNKHLGKKLTAHGWASIPQSLGLDIEKTANLGKP